MKVLYFLVSFFLIFNPLLAENHSHNDKGKKSSEKFGCDCASLVACESFICGIPEFAGIGCIPQTGRTEAIENCIYGLTAPMPVLNLPLMSHCHNWKAIFNDPGCAQQNCDYNGICK